jgi:hypothetical protein
MMMSRLFGATLRAAPAEAETASQEITTPMANPTEPWKAGGR